MHSVVAALSIVTGIANGWQVVTLLQQRVLLASYDVTQPLMVTLTMGILWSFVLIVGGIVTWRKWLPSRKLLPIAFLCYTLYNVFWLTPTRPFIVWYIFLTIFTTLALNINWRQVGLLFRADSNTQ